MSYATDPGEGERAAVLVTGANRGIGWEAAVALQRKGSPIVVHARTMERAADTAHRLRGAAASTGSGPVPEVVPVSADLADLDSVTACAEAVLALDQPLAALINNAGVLTTELARNDRGQEMQIAVNHLGHFALTALLMPRLLDSAPSRIVNVTSASHFGPALDLDDPHYRDRPYDPKEAYHASKLAGVLFTAGLARRLRGTGVSVVAAGPGAVRTDLLGTFLGASRFALSLFPGPAKAGEILARLALREIAADETGAYVDRGAVARPSKAAQDRKGQEALWTWSVRETGARWPDLPQRGSGGGGGEGRHP